MTDEILEAAVRLTEAFMARAEITHLLPPGASRGADDLGEGVGRLFTLIYEAVGAAHDKMYSK